MSTNTPMASLPYPSLSDAPNVPSDVQKLADALDSLVIPRFATPTDRDQKITAPTAGQVCYVTSLDQLQLYRSGSGTGTGWQRVAWNQGWGVVGGKRYGVSKTLCAGLSSTEAITNMDTGTVTLITGRLYQIRVKINYAMSGTGDDWFVMKIRRNSATGAEYGEFVIHESNNNLYGREAYIDADLGNIGSLTDTFVLTGTRLAGTDNMNVMGNSSYPCYMYVQDLGPYANIIETT